MFVGDRGRVESKREQRENRRKRQGDTERLEKEAIALPCLFHSYVSLEAEEKGERADETKLPVFFNVDSIQ